MNRLLRVAIALVCAIGIKPAHGQMTTITASSIKMGGKTIAAGTVTFTPVNVAGIPIAFDQGGGGLNSPDAFSCTIFAGAITGTCQIPDAALTSQANILYSIQVTNTASQRAFTFSAVPNITGATWALDSYAPPAQTTNVEPIQVAYGTAAPPSACVSPSFYVRNFSGGLLYMCVGGVPVLVTGSGTGSGGVGPAGQAATITIGAVTGLAPGSTPTVQNTGTTSAAVLAFGVPAGAQGATGSAGSTGATGVAATVAIGTVTTGAAGSAAAVTNAGTTGAAVLNFNIPQGAAGATGAKGDTGLQGLSGGSTTWRGAWVGTTNYALYDAVSYLGSSYISLVTNTNVIPGTNPADWQILALAGAAGATGTAGASSTIVVGTVTPLAAGATPTVSNSGSSSAATFNFGIPAGATGATGTQGTTGTTGSPGTAATVSVGSVSTGAAGSAAAVSNAGTTSAAVLNFTIPQGLAGATGSTGTTGTAGAAATIAVGTVTPLSAGATPTVSNSGSSSAATLNFGIPAGATGATGSTGTTGTAGAAATVAVGTVTPLAAGATPTVTNSGTPSAAVLAFGIPAGAMGSTGSAGSAATISVGTVTTGAPASSATVSNSGTTSGAVLNFTIPQGLAGATGSTGSNGSAATVSVGTVTALAPGATPTVSNTGSSSAAVLAFGIPSAGTPTFSSLTDSASVTWAIGSAIVANSTLTLVHTTGTRALNLTGLVNGGSYVVVLKQDSTGGAAATLGTGCTWFQGGSAGFTASTTLALTTTASTVNILAFIYDGSNCYANLR
ncbi:MAG: Collagen triple helix repeat-containing protein [Edaphobacter sp.]|nr:Collagen triple helix repeat-containing protein [Edaphobacter sp.]